MTNFNAVKYDHFSLYLQFTHQYPWESLQQNQDLTQSEESLWPWAGPARCGQHLTGVGRTCQVCAAPDRCGQHRWLSAQPAQPH